MSAPVPSRAPRAQPAERLAALPAQAWALVALTALAAVVRFSTLSVQSFWLDEAVTVTLLRRSFGDMLAAIPGSESTPPLYYAVAWLWTHVFGTGEVGLRSLSALIGTATVPLAYSAGARFVSQRAGLVVAALAAVNPLLVWFSQEARAYALLVLLTTASLAVFARLLDRPTGRALAGWAVLSALALAAHYFAFFVVAPEAVWLLWRARGQRWARGAWAAAAAVALAGAGLLPLVVEQADNDRAGFIRDISVGTRIVQVPKQYLVGFDGPVEALTTAVALALVLAGLWLLVRRGDTAERAGALRATAIAAPAVLVPIALALVGADYLITRNLIAGWVPAALVVAAGFGARRAGPLGPALAAALCLLSLAVVVAVDADPSYQRSDWRGAARAAGAPVAGGRAFVLTPVLGATPLSLYTRVRTLPAAGAAVSEIDAIATLEHRGTSTPPLPGRSVAHPPPPGFAVVQVKTTGSYTLVRYRAVGAPVPVSFPLLQGLKLAPGTPDVAYQPAR
jgi:mannosyltransferase